MLANHEQCNNEPKNFELNWELLKNICSYPSPTGMEGALSYGLILPYLNNVIKNKPNWKIHKFKGSAGIIIEKKPKITIDSNLSLMFIAHTDKIKMQVRHIDDNGKVYINSGSFLPQTLIGNEVYIYSFKKPEGLLSGGYVKIKGTIEAIQPIHYIDKSYITSDKCVKQEQLYIDVGLYDKKSIIDLGVTIGDPILLYRPIEKTVSCDVFKGAYLDDGVGCMSVTELAHLVAEDETPFDSLHLYFGFSTHEEINRYGSRIFVHKFKPDILIGVDACHDYDRAPKIDSFVRPSVKMGFGPVLTNGSIISNIINKLLIKGFTLMNVKYQLDVAEVDTNTDSMSAGFTGIDSAVGNVGIPVLNMHTISEIGSLADIRSAINGMYGFLVYCSSKGIKVSDLKKHVNLNNSIEVTANNIDNISEIVSDNKLNKEIKLIEDIKKDIKEDIKESQIQTKDSQINFNNLDTDQLKRYLLSQVSEPSSLIKSRKQVKAMNEYMKRINNEHVKNNLNINKSIMDKSIMDKSININKSNVKSNKKSIITDEDKKIFREIRSMLFGSKNKKKFKKHKSKKRKSNSKN